MGPSVRVAVSAILLVGLAGQVTLVRAYNPPVDSASGITVRIEGPSEVDGNMAFPVTLIVENSRSDPIKGSIRLGLIDGFSADPPGPFPIEVAGKQTLRKEVQVRPGDRVFNAHYPVHVWAVFDLSGATVELHPILIFK
jgi:hypothetical protein